MSDAIGAEAAQIAGSASLLSSVVDRDMSRREENRAMMSSGRCLSERGTGCERIAPHHH